MKKKIAALLCAVLMLSGCADKPESSQPTELVVSNAPAEESGISAFPVTVCGAEISASAQRVVSLSPAVTEIIAELGFSDKLVGKSRYCDYPESISCAEVGSAENPETEKIIGLKPDVVFSLSALAERDIYALQSAGAAVVVLSVPADMEGYAALYRDVAYAFFGKEQTTGGKQTEVAALAGNSARTAAETAAANVKLGSFVYVTGKLTLAGSGTFENALLSLCGENLVTADGYCDAASLGETVPEYIIADDSLSAEQLRADDTIGAAINGGATVLYVSSRCFERPTKRSAEIFTQMSEQLLPAEE